MSTVDKDEDGVLTPFKQTFYKATPQRNFEIALSSDGEPVSISAQFTLLEDANGDFVDMIEIEDDAIELVKTVGDMVRYIKEKQA